jgi:hypothetical protein
MKYTSKKIEQQRRIEPKDAALLRYDGHDVFLAHNKELFTINLNGRAGVLAEQNLVANFHVNWRNFAVFVFLAWANGEHFTLVWLLSGGIRDNDAGGGLPLFFKTLDDHTIVQGT